MRRLPRKPSKKVEQAPQGCLDWTDKDERQGSTQQKLHIAALEPCCAFPKPINPATCFMINGLTSSPPQHFGGPEAATASTCPHVSHALLSAFSGNGQHYGMSWSRIKASEIVRSHDSLSEGTRDKLPTWEQASTVPVPVPNQSESSVQAFSTSNEALQRGWES